MAAVQAIGVIGGSGTEMKVERGRRNQ